MGYLPPFRDISVTKYYVDLWCLASTPFCDYGTPWTFLLPFFLTWFSLFCFSNTPTVAFVTEYIAVNNFIMLSFMFVYYNILHTNDSLTDNKMHNMK